jgi:A/G-specific adenine glycosylase
MAATPRSCAFGAGDDWGDDIAMSTELTVWPAATLTTLGEVTGVVEVVGGADGVGVGAGEGLELVGEDVPPHPSRNIKKNKNRALFTITSSRSVQREMSLPQSRVAKPKVGNDRIDAELRQNAQFEARARAKLRRRLLVWYDASRRDLPWRRTHDPYRIWVSEIMLQQTRVAAVIERYGQFVEQFPDVKALADAEQADVLAMWSGLGYYRRARAMHEAARRIVSAGGVMPRTDEEWRALPGIGRYTAAAIASIAFDQRCAVVDGNVERVVHRVTGKRASRAEIWDIAEDWLSPKRPGDFNQATMELGATVCLPFAPHCAECPIRCLCTTRGELPAKPVAERRRARVAYALPLRKAAVYLKQRDAAERLMPGMWELPQVTPNGHAPEFTVRHSITVTDYTVDVFRANGAWTNGRWVKFSDVLSLPLTGLTRKILRRAQII